jgi:hypothetical protein
LNDTEREPVSPKVLEFLKAISPVDGDDELAQKMKERHNVAAKLLDLRVEVQILKLKRQSYPELLMASASRIQAGNERLISNAVSNWRLLVRCCRGGRHVFYFVSHALRQSSTSCGCQTSPTWKSANDGFRCSPQPSVGC